jgi:vanillate O-demethylase monooxygenase subunit
MVYPRNEWYVACFEDELDAGAPVSTQVLGSWLVLWRAGKSVVAMDDRCVHRAARLSQGRCEGDSLRCMYHGLRYDAVGKVVEIPGQDLIPESARVRTYAVEVRCGWIWVWMGNPAEADRGRLPNLPDQVSLSDFITGAGALDFSAEARLISDNLLDFSHLAFVHASSFGADLAWAHTPMKATLLERGVRAERWIENSSGPAFLNLSDTCDEWLGYDYLVPGVLVMLNGVFPKGTAELSGFRKPDLSLAIGGLALNVQAVTPKTERTARYYFLTGPHRNFGDEASRDAMVAINHQAFAEDKLMIEGQQIILDATPELTLMPTIHDRGITMYNRLMDRLSMIAEPL